MHRNLYVFMLYTFGTLCLLPIIGISALPEKQRGVHKSSPTVEEVLFAILVSEDVTKITEIYTQKLADTTEENQVCPDKTFGENCEFPCRCLDEDESCDAHTGHCSSGCPAGHYGAGCLLMKLSSSLSIVSVLGILLSISITVNFLLVYYAFIHQPRVARRNKLVSRAEAAAYDFHEMEAQKRKSLIPTIEFKKVIPRISELDIQIMADVLGSGRFGDIMRGFLKRSNGQQEVAFKTTKRGSTEQELEDFVLQLELHSSYEPCTNVVQFFGVCAVGDQMYAAFEYMPHGNLRNFLRSYTGPEDQGGGQAPELDKLGPRQMLLKLAHDIALGMRHLAKNKIVHRELSARAILLGSDYTAKVSGLHAPCQIPNKNRPLRWMSPEALTKGEFSIQSDIWSFGMVLWEIATMGGKPFADISSKELPEALESGERPPAPEDCDADIYALMKWCWQPTPDDRPSFLILANTMSEMMQIDLEDICTYIEDSDIEQSD